MQIGERLVSIRILATLLAASLLYGCREQSPLPVSVCTVNNSPQSFVDKRLRLGGWFVQGLEFTALELDGCEIIVVFGGRKGERRRAIAGEIQLDRQLEAVANSGKQKRVYVVIEGRYESVGTRRLRGVLRVDHVHCAEIDRACDSGAPRMNTDE